MKYTKKQRHEIYKKALSRIKEFGNNPLCLTLANTSREESCEYVCMNQLPELLPEFYFFQPIGEPFIWFSDEDQYEQRKTVIEFCIYMTTSPTNGR